jgi:probable F420-dependent oxidoreductase
MKFALGMPALILYPAIMSPWEPDASPADVLRVARKADQLGFDWLTISEHIVMPTEMADVMGRRFPESLTAAAVLAGATERIRMLTYVLVLPYRHPVTLAKQIATLDFLSGGRFTLGTGGGHLEREFEVLNVPFAERGKRTDEYIAAMRELWMSEEPSFQGEYVQFDKVAFEPKPIQKPHPPILIGGNSRPAMRRAARVGDGWLPWLVTREQLPGCLAYIQDQPEFGARADHFEVVMPLATFQVEDFSHREVGKTHLHSGRQEIIDEIGLLGDAGTTVTGIVPPRTPSVGDYLEWLEWFIEEIKPAFVESTD